MPDERVKTLDEVINRLVGKFQETVKDPDSWGGGILHSTGEDMFRTVLGKTVGQHSTGVVENWGRDHGFLYEVTKRIAARAVRYAKKENDNPGEVKRIHVIQAANCLIPDISRYCALGRSEAKSPLQTEGVYCKDWDEIPEN